MKRRLSKLYSAVIATGVVAAASSFSPVQAQLASLDKGHNLLVNSGLQIWGCDTGAAPFNYSGLTGANFNGVMWSFGQSKAGQLTAGQKWGKWVDANPANGGYLPPASALDSTENAHYSDLLAIQVGDEQQSDMENPNGYTRAWFDAARNGNYFNDKLLYINSTYWNDVGNWFNFIAAANPDAISWDAYPFGTTGVYPYNWLGKAQFYRRSALGSYIGASGNAARPYGLYLQTYHGGDGARDPGDLEMRWQQFTAWTMGYTFVDTFSVGGGTSLFVGSNMNVPDQPRYNQFKESARQSRNLGPALVKLISYGYGPNIILGKDPSGATNPIPADWPVFNKTNAPPNQQYLTGVSALNLGSKNNGQPGDVYVGFFNPLLTSYGDPAGTAYFMVANALGAYLQDPSLLVSDCTQQLTLNFDFGSSGITSLQRLRRSDGQVEIVPLTHLTGSQYQLVFNLDGGTGDLFKYYDGSPFVGIEPPPTTMYWDADGASAGNNTTTGAGLGGSGTWDSSSNKWYPGSGSDSKWSSGSLAIFHGPSGGTVILSTPQSASSLTFKTNGYVLTGSTLTMTGQSIVTDANVSARIDAPIAGAFGIVKSGPGTLILNNSANSYAGGTTVSAGTLSISADGNLGAVPSSLSTNLTIGGGTLQFTATMTLNPNRGIDLGASGGTIDVTSAGASLVTYAPTNGFRGGDLTKTGNGVFFASATTGGVNNLWTGNLIIKQGTWRIQATDGLPINPTSGGPRPAQVTLDGGTWQIAANINATQSNRGITVAAGGGTIDTQSFNLTWPGALSGSVATSVLNKTGSGILRLNTAPTASNYPGTFNVNAGTLQLNGGTAMGDLASINLANTAGVSLVLTGGSETIGSLSGGGTSGGNVSLNTFTLTTGGNGSSSTYSGVISSSGSLTKLGSGTMTLSNANTYTGATNVTVGKLVFAANHTSSSSLNIQTGGDTELAAGNSRIIKTAVLSIVGNGQLNLTDNKLITQSAIGSLSGSAYTGVTGLIASGRNNTTWSGPGIITSMSDAQNSNHTSIGIARGVEVKSATASTTALWGGQTITGTDTLVMYTYGGDANLDGKINIDDYIKIDQGFAGGLTGWSNGDFNYDGKVNIDDYTMVIDANFGNQNGTFPTADGVVAIPEPIAGAMMILPAIAMTLRRRERRD